MASPHLIYYYYVSEFTAENINWFCRKWERDCGSEKIDLYMECN